MEIVDDSADYVDYEDCARADDPCVAHTDYMVDGSMDVHIVDTVVDDIAESTHKGVEA